ncbi:hypothetical protein MELA_01924 [Candidatus Methylomirabilis lanthanidiphila]|uniref:Uncharacterized protein n=1 Tax=Candidatus Methylomirabilis lanthanidiphila TaxID=2211376 RepID=A0A564ZJM8_9BACT|nr:hypothetical protein [Candidatus Methylomirabilis lanthanidiphila]VUZ85539.1 hypothetical protein MELA_01924 [Candidatus Methylomirabilis lanthanidiphila]
MTDDLSTAAAVGSALAKAFQEFRRWVAQRLAQKTALEEKELNAVRAFQTAVIRTSNYIGSLEGGGQGDRRHEEDLANLWSDAAIAFYGVNDNIAPLLHLKALSWSRPAQWIDAKVIEAGITITEMNELLTQILEKGDAST